MLERSHKAERPFKCDLCDKAAARKGSRKERPYKRDLCNYAAIRSLDLLEHSRKHKGPFSDKNPYE